MTNAETPIAYESQVLWPDTTWGPWCLDLSWELHDDRWILAGFSMRSRFRTDGRRDALAEAHDRYRSEAPADVEPPGRPRELTARELRSLRLGDLVQQESLRWERLMVEAAGSAGSRAAYAAHPEPGRPGRPPLYAPDHFAEVARVYAGAYRNQSRNPTLTVSREFHVSRSTAAKWVARARRLGFLQRTQRRVAGGIPAGPAHTVGLSDRQGPPFVRFSGEGGTVYTVWIAQPPDVDRDRLTAFLSGEPQALDEARRTGPARALVELLGHSLSPQEDALLKRYAAHDTGADFWTAVAAAGLTADESGPGQLLE